MKLKTLFATLSLACLGSVAAEASVITTINPTSDGSLYTCGGCNVVSDGAYVLTSGYIQGAVKFATLPASGIVTSAVLSLNPYGLPLWGPNVDVYGYGTSIGALHTSDANAGTFLGTLVLPANLGYGQDAFFDVTNFVRSISAPYIAFNLRSVGTNVFSSLEYNYGHPAQLTVTTIPEPMTIALLGFGLIAFAFRRRVSKAVL